MCAASLRHMYVKSNIVMIFGSLKLKPKFDESENDLPSGNGSRYLEYLIKLVIYFRKALFFDKNQLLRGWSFKVEYALAYRICVFVHKGSRRMMMYFL